MTSTLSSPTCVAELGDIQSMDLRSEDCSAAAWATEVVRESMSAHCTTLGITYGSRQVAPTWVACGVAELISCELQKLLPRAQVLIVRLETATALHFRNRLPDGESDSRPIVKQRGTCSEVCVSHKPGRNSRSVADRVQQWLPEWKREFRFLLLDLGPIDRESSREIGRLCDSCYVLLGPDMCASHEWILQHIGWHDRCGSTISGTLVVTA